MSHDLRGVGTISKTDGRLTRGLGNVGGGGGDGFLDVALVAAAVVAWGAALGAGVWHSSSPFHTGDRAVVVGGVALWKNAEDGKGCDFTLTAAHLLHRRLSVECFKDTVVCHLSLSVDLI